ncbi:MAG: hypothetical protein JWP58_1933 [Hymenobacter sp.]|nr:hypothetical protein [Hymenobacter sp.]
MDEPYLGEIRAIAYDYAPKGWAFCAGQTLPINSNQALFSLLGTTYGGNGVTTFNLPNLQGRVPVGIGQLPGGGSYVLGQQGGNESVTLTQAQLPAHIHPITGTMKSGSAGEETGAPGDYPAPGTVSMYAAGTKNAIMGAANGITGTTAAQGGSAPHDNRMPYLATYYVIALQGIFPSRA